VCGYTENKNDGLKDVATKIYRKFEEYLAAKQEKRARGENEPTLVVLEKNLDQILEWLSQLDPETKLWINDKGKFVTALDYQKDLYNIKYRHQTKLVELDKMGDRGIGVSQPPVVSTLDDESGDAIGGVLK
jgi:hypothetical protein